MRIGIIGIGGVGGYFGGKLAREYENSSEHEIIFIARGEHLKAIQEKRLTINHERRKTTLPGPKICHGQSRGSRDF